LVVRVILLVAAIIFSALNPSRAAEKAPETGNDFLRQCSGVLQAFRPGSNPFVEGWCVGVVHALRFMADAEKDTHDPNLIRSCMPHEVEDGQAMRVVLNFLRKNPAQLHFDAQVLVLAAFRDSWPCKS
jgi:hypothetical protein